MTRDLKLFIEFASEKQDQRNLEDIEAKQLNEYLCGLILSVKRRNGQDYELSNLRDLFSSFNRHLKEWKYLLRIIEDAVVESYMIHERARYID